MKSFLFKRNNISNITIDKNGWLFKFCFKGNLGIFSLKTPIMKEVSYSSKAPAVQYKRHCVYGIGIINSNGEYSGLAFFDPFTRILIFSIILFGVFYASLSIVSGVIFASLFYILILFLSSEDDDKLLCQCKLMFETDP